MTQQNRASDAMTSEFAPLHPNGPLPPGVTDAIIADAYRKLRPDLKPKKILRLLGHRISTIASTDALRQRLRKTLDDRRARQQPLADDVPPFHEVIYSWVKEQDWAKAIYKAVVSQAEVDRDKKVFLDPKQFGRFLQEHGPNLSSQETDTQFDKSQSQALTFFVLAFGLLQPDDAYDMAAALIAVDPSASP